MKKIPALLIVPLLLLCIACDGTTKKKVVDDDTTGGDTIVETDGDAAVTDADLAATCGNGSIDLGEPCDGDTKNCTAIDPVKFTGGKAKCKTDCSGYDTITCDENPAICGNGIVESPEKCDGTIDNCIDIDPLVFVAGKARCKTDCTGWDTETCESSGDYCGDGEKSDTEFCDGDAKACTDLNPLLYESGTAPCNASCSGYDTTACVVIQSECKDGVVEGIEICDGGPDGKAGLRDCVEIDPFLYSGGKAYCLDDCTGYDTVTCEENTSGTLFSDQFENGSAKWLIEKDWAVGIPSYTNGEENITAAYSGLNVLATNLTGPYALATQGLPYTQAAIIAKPISVPSGKTTTLMFRAYAYTEYYTSTSDPTQNKWYDGLIVEVYDESEKLGEADLSSNSAALLGEFSIPSGGGYVVKNGIRGHSVANTYSLFTADLSAYAGKAVTISFLFVSDYITSHYGVAIDDVSITTQ